MDNPEKNKVDKKKTNKTNTQYNMSWTSPQASKNKAKANKI
jgi:hypothetical protein